MSENSDSTKFTTPENTNHEDKKTLVWDRRIGLTKLKVGTYQGFCMYYIIIYNIGWNMI